MGTCNLKTKKYRDLSGQQLTIIAAEGRNDNQTYDSQSQIAQQQSNLFQNQVNIEVSTNNKTPNLIPPDEDIYINDVMKQFDELNQLFNQMNHEFDSISKYLLSTNENQAAPQ